MLDWDDYRVVLAIARGGNLSAAGKALGVALSTVIRRLDRIEDQLDTELFERNRGVCVPTEAGQELAQAGERMEQEALAGSRALSGSDQRLRGTVRVTATEVLATFFLARHMASFHAKHPGLLVEIISDNRQLSLADREADLALRPTRPKEEALVGRKMTTLAWGIYGSAAILAEIGAVPNIAALSGRDFVGWDGNRAAREISAWLEDSVPDLSQPYRSGSLIANAALAAAGTALVPLPCILGSNWPGLHLVLGPLAGIEAEVWIVMHEQMRRNARVRALVEHLLSACALDRRLFGAPAAEVSRG